MLFGKGDTAEVSAFPMLCFVHSTLEVLVVGGRVGFVVPRLGVKPGSVLVYVC